MEKRTLNWQKSDFYKKFIYFLDNTCTFNNLMRSLKTKLLKYLILCAGLVASVVSDSLWPYGPWPARLLCPWYSPGKLLEWVAISFSNVILHLITTSSSSMNRILQFAMVCYCLISHIWLCDPMDWSIPGFLVLYHLLEFAQTHVHRVDDAIQPFHLLLSPSLPALNLSQHQSFPVSQLFASGGQSIGVSASTSVLPMNIQGWFPLGLTGLISLLSKWLSWVFSSTTVWKLQFFSAQPSLWPNSNIQTWLLEKPYISLYGLWSAKWCFCFLIHCLKLQSLATWREQLNHWKRPWCWERLKAEGEEGDRGWDGWMAT